MSNTSTATALEVRLHAHQTTYFLDLGGRTPAAFQRHVEQLHEKMLAGGFVPRESYPEPPVVDLELEIVNCGSNEVEVWLGGDDERISLELTGPAALSVANGGPFTANIVHSEPVKLPPGGHHRIPIHQLYHGARGYSQQCYWTAPGQYTLTACWQLGANAEFTGQDYQVPAAGPTLVSNSVTLEVR